MRTHVDPHEIETVLLQAVTAPDLDQVRPARRARPRHLRHFELAPQVQLDAGSRDQERTLLSLVSTDRPGLLADVARVLRQQRLRVHDARIATFGARAEDVFQITDEHDRALRRSAAAARLARCAARMPERRNQRMTESKRAKKPRQGQIEAARRPAWTN